MSPENAIYAVLTAIDDADVHPTVYSKIAGVKTIRVGNCESEFAPFGESVKEINADCVLQILVRVEDAENSETYPIARDDVRDLTLAVCDLLLGDRTLNGAVCDLQILPAFRGWSRVETGYYATALLPVRMNPTN